MMDLKEIIKWFIPCFHILTLKLKNANFLLAFFCLFLILNPCTVVARISIKNNDILVSKDVKIANNLSVSVNSSNEVREYEKRSGNEANASVNMKSRSLEDMSTGRTFGRPFKKMMAGLIPVIFQVGAASTWAVVAALVGVKTLVVTLVILKLLLVAGAAKIGALFASKGHGHSEHHSHGWEAPPLQKEIHLHIHNDRDHQVHHEEHVPYSAPWSREGYVNQDVKGVNIILDPYKGGPQTISTPFGNYVKIDPSGSAT